MVDQKAEKYARERRKPTEPEKPNDYKYMETRLKPIDWEEISQKM